MRLRVVCERVCWRVEPFFLKLSNDGLQPPGLKNMAARISPLQGKVTKPQVMGESICGNSESGGMPISAAKGAPKQGLMCEPVSWRVDVGVHVCS